MGRVGDPTPPLPAVGARCPAYVDQVHQLVQ